MPSYATEYWDGGSLKAFRGIVIMTPDDTSKPVVKPVMHAKEGPWAVQRRSGVVATSDFGGRRRDANGSRRS